MADAGRPAGPDLVQVPQHVQSGAAPAVVQLAVREHAEQGGLADVGVTQHGQTKVDGVTVVRYLAGGGRGQRSRVSVRCQCRVRGHVSGEDRV